MSVNNRGVARAEESELISFYGHLEGVTKLRRERTGRDRINLFFDSVRKDFKEQGGYENNLAYVRVMTTPRRLDELSKSANSPEEGQWAEFTLQKEHGGPRAWVVRSTALFGGPVDSWRLHSIKYLPKPPTLPFQGPDQRSIAQSVQLASKGEPAVRVIDVGQANMSAIHESKDIKSPILGYFDVGYPIFWNLKTQPSLSAMLAESNRIPNEGFVILSHWDYDHYSLALKFQKLKQLDWYAPAFPPIDQLGPIGRNFRNSLPNLQYLTSSTLTHSVGSLWEGTGNDRNSKGYVMRLFSCGRSVLLTGDVGYDHIPAPAANGLGGVVVPHHGSDDTASPPTPSQPQSKAIFSYGEGNSYRHPHVDTIQNHVAKSWTIAETAITYTTPRGDRWLD